MAKLQLRDLPQETWTRFKARADTEGWDQYALIEQLMDDYGNGRITPSAPPVTKRSLPTNRS